ncbi:hypothetical protein DPMN_186176 [Dreissena polymorpha]|uniref:Uncharacterized protein n=1 Tax=Dreissena polymorpha TaxID=45954 RepID=A0A9D4DMF4_DREPO|nr:hypothetical protein DPMN_186176 [Dreissena polymorpha]
MDLLSMRMSTNGTRDACHEHHAGDMDLLSLRMSTNGTHDACHEHHAGDMDLLDMRMSIAVTSDACINIKVLVHAPLVIDSTLALCILNMGKQTIGTRGACYMSRMRHGSLEYAYVNHRYT